MAVGAYENSFVWQIQRSGDRQATPVVKCAKRPTDAALYPLEFREWVLTACASSVSSISNDACQQSFIKATLQERSRAAGILYLGRQNAPCRFRADVENV